MSDGYPLGADCDLDAIAACAACDYTDNGYCPCGCHDKVFRELVTVGDRVAAPGNGDAPNLKEH